MQSVQISENVTSMDLVKVMLSCVSALKEGKCMTDEDLLNTVEHFLEYQNEAESGMEQFLEEKGFEA